MTRVYTERRWDANVEPVGQAIGDMTPDNQVDKRDHVHDVSLGLADHVLDVLLEGLEVAFGAFVGDLGLAESTILAE